MSVEQIICRCACHDDPSVMHFAPCCDQAYVRRRAMSEPTKALDWNRPLVPGKVCIQHSSMADTIATLRTLLDRATPGEWSLDTAALKNGHILVESNRYCIAKVYDVEPGARAMHEANAALIAAAVNALPGLLDTIERLTAALGRES